LRTTGFPQNYGQCDAVRCLDCSENNELHERTGTRRTRVRIAVMNGLRRKKRRSASRSIESASAHARVPGLAWLLTRPVEPRPARLLKHSFRTEQCAPDACMIIRAEAQYNVIELASRLRHRIARGTDDCRGLHDGIQLSPLLVTSRVNDAGSANNEQSVKVDRSTTSSQAGSW
jgi:hypothetical protein